MIKILAACGAGVNSNHQVKSALQKKSSQVMDTMYSVTQLW